jgi:ABC-type transporter Mla MlaB component
MSSLAEVSAMADREARDGSGTGEIIGTSLAGAIRIPIFRNFTIDRDSRIRQTRDFLRRWQRRLVCSLRWKRPVSPWVAELEMLKIQRSMNANNVRFALSGRIDHEHLAELQRLVDEDAQRGTITLDLREVRLVDREAVEFLARSEANGVRLRNCPAYLREWIASGKLPPANPPRKTRG